MKKKVLAIFLVLILSLVTMVGCSSAEINYLKMIKDTYDEKGAEVNGSVDLEIDYDALFDYFIANDFLDSSELDKDIMENQVKYDKISFGFDGKVSMNPIAYDLNMDITLGGEKIELGNMILNENKGMFISGDFFTGALKIANMFETSEGGEAFTENMIKAIEENMGDIGYASLLSQEEMAFIMNLPFSQMTFGQGEIDLITNMFKNFSTDTVTQSGNSINTTLDLKELSSILIEALGYIANNQDDFILALEEYISTDNYKKIGLPQERADEAIAGIKENKEAIKVGALQSRKMIEMISKDKLFEEIKDSSYVMNITKTSDGLNGEEDIKFIANGKTLLNITSEYTSVWKEIDVKIPTNTIDIDILKDVYSNAVNTTYPINGAEISWYHSDDTHAQTYYKREGKGAYWSNMYDSVYHSFKVKDGSGYIHLRHHSEAFGEEVGWDNDTKKAYIMKDGEKIAMEGILVYDEYDETSHTLVKIRDFEKLGYKIDYTFQGNEKGHTVVLTKQ